ncbi:trypsin-like peptidase domain-containing protein [Cognatishimia activa]|uniref:Periplasmic pH-dependent serine endoprotease DegQ n=1 Tax=Cognatishimia activa TaxID=1715691 RepID=A0A0P1IMR8_9RHOB|nr:trypsin-like peptidase domain-containing protein [Cognatishimia activa]MEE2809616.1 trypsin-like peptidase domain-containing protein [Pseudomonadota bacterium]CUI31009.1 Periplasmic pH-dependent serine endoprotease DegQ precursor [Cognatishimia activa]CUK24845.1 Periplasmic pH-dependent serine endoprotease DegQ precursor [Cognatishimia activa]
MFRAAFTCLLLSVATLGFAETRVPQNQQEIQLGFAPLVKQTGPAVVNIYAKRVVEVRESPFSGDPFFQNLFRDFGTARPRVQNSLGSGVILSSDGIVVSNYHVVGMATDIRVVLNDRREFTAQVLLSDEANDLAILQLDDPEDMPHLPLRDSDSVEVGELVLAIGNPFGVGQTVSSGIVSGLARTGAAAGTGQGYFIQTDAPINPGNSGGALIDVNGDLIGINTRILTRSGGSNGIGFAIPANLVAAFVEQAKAGNDRFEKPWAGASGQPVDADIAESLGLDRPGGILISDLHPASPFLAAGINPGDVILAVDGQPVTNGAEMIFRMSVAGLGGTAEMAGILSGKPGAIDVALIAPPNSPDRETIETSEQTVLPRMTVSRVNPALIAEIGLALNAEGVVVESPGDLGARVGLRAGDIILQINEDVIERTSDVEAALREVPRRVSILVQRGSRRVNLRFRL